MEFLGKDYYISARNLRMMDKRMSGSMLLSYSMEEMKMIRRNLAWEFGILFMSSFFLIVIIGSYISGKVTSPINKLIDQMKNIAADKPSSNVDVKTNDEIGVLANHFNEMINAITRKNESLQAYSENLERKVAERTKMLNQAVQEIDASLKEKEILLKEVHHRIRNNMAIIKGLLTLQSKTLENNPEAVTALKEAENRVKSMLLLYDKLFLSSDYVNVSTKKYFESLIDEIVQNFPNKDIVKVEFDIADIILDAKIIFNLGIIINELITNTMKYAFVGKEQGKIKTSLSIDEGHAIIDIQDDGIEIPESISFGNPAAGFGFKLVSMLINQLNGSIKIERGNGTKFTVKFNIET